MMAAARHEMRLITRRAAWPVAVAGNAITAALFVIVWGPAGGVPLWQASVLQQLAAAERVAAAVLLTWLTTYVVADERDRSLADWSVLTGRPIATVFRARLAAMVLLAVAFVSVAAPAFAAAGEEAAASLRAIVWQMAGALSFAFVSVAVTAAASLALKSRLALWCAAMTTCLVAGVAVRWFETDTMRAVVPAAIAMALLVTVPNSVRGWRSGDAR